MKRILSALAVAMFALLNVSQAATPFFDDVVARLKQKIIQSRYSADTKKNLKSTLLHFGDHAVYTLGGSDTDKRRVIVGMQHLFEEVLYDLKQANLLSPSSYAIIHTPKPATPLCQAEAAPVAASVTVEVDATNTVAERTVSVRNLLRSGFNIHNAFPSNGKASLPSNAARDAFQEALRAWNSLTEFELQADPEPPAGMDEIAIHPTMIGATYYIQPADGLSSYLFFTQNTQASSPDNESPWSISFAQVVTFHDMTAQHMSHFNNLAVYFTRRGFNLFQTTIDNGRRH